MPASQENATTLVECPRDAMQGIQQFIPTEEKISYLNTLLRVGFDTLDCGSFVSPKAIPQMADTAEVIKALDVQHSGTRLLVIVANERGAEQACSFEQITFLGFPLSVSETFQQRNTNASIAEAIERLRAIQQLCIRHNKQLVVYFSMAFGNPYNDAWSPSVIAPFVEQMIEMGVRTISLADTVGVAKPEDVSFLFTSLIPQYPEVRFGAHLHVHADNWKPKLEAAYRAGCRRFDGALKGFGGCPMAMDKLVGNLPTENIIAFLGSAGEKNLPDQLILQQALLHANDVFKASG
jgi:hydroxymethylglutaryl-CoA lyase